MSDPKISEEESKHLEFALHNALDQMSIKELYTHLYDQLSYYYEFEAPEVETRDFLETYGKEFNASLTGKESPCK